MRGTEMLWFDDISALNEPVLFFPVLGRISMKQFAILGISSLASYAIFSSGHSPLAAVPACVGAALALVRPRAGTAEWMAFAMLLFLARTLRLARPRIPWKGRAGLPRRARPAGTVVVSPGPRARTIVVADPSRPVIFRVRLEGGGGRVGCRSFRIRLGGVPTESVSTDVNGTVEAVIVPSREGPVSISVEADGGIPVLSETVEVRAAARP